MFAAVSIVCTSSKLSQAQTTPGSVVQNVGFDQKPGAAIPLDLEFHDESGKTVQLANCFGQRPVILTLVYYRCPMLCSKELDALTRTLRTLSEEPGRDFELVTVSIDPKEASELAARKKASYIEAYGRPEGAKGWHFLTGNADSIRQLTESVGFRYVYNPATGLFAHDAGLVILTADGRIARYFSGLDYPAKTLRDVLKQTSRGETGRAIAWVRLLCYDYDPRTGKYTLAIMRVLRICGVATFVTLATAITAFIYVDRRKSRTLVPAQS